MTFNTILLCISKFRGEYAQISNISIYAADFEFISSHSYLSNFSSLSRILSVDSYILVEIDVQICAFLDFSPNNSLVSGIDMSICGWPGRVLIILIL